MGALSFLRATLVALAGVERRTGWVVAGSGARKARRLDFRMVGAAGMALSDQ